MRRSGTTGLGHAASMNVVIVEDEDADLVILDLELPRLSGTEVLARPRIRRPDAPVIILAARDAVEDRVRNLEAGPTAPSTPTPRTTPDRAPRYRPRGRDDAYAGRMAATPRDALGRLRRLAESGELTDICERHGLDLLVVHGSVLDTDGEPSDLDVAVWPRDRTSYDVLALVEALTQATGCEQVDVLDLSRAGVVARGLALERCEPLYERVAGLFARRRMAALPALADTAWIRDLGLETMAGS